VTWPWREQPGWRNRDVWAISLSACFADLGYQSVLAGFPLFLVLALHQPVWEFGLASALSYGGGALFSYLGGRLGGRVGHRRLALAGNAGIPLLSLSALIASPAAAIGLLTGGWWARNLRTPSRRVMLVEAVPDEANRSSAFGFLHALDVGGGALAGLYVLVAVLSHVEFRWVFLGTVLPLAISTLSLSRARTGLRVAPSQPLRAPSAEARAPAVSGAGTQPLPAAGALLAAAALYGFTSYSVGFPVLTVAQGGHHLAYGIAAFLVFQAVSAATGYLLGGRLGTGIPSQFANLGLLGYLMAGLGAVMLAAGYATRAGTAELLVGVAVLGFALGVVETLEPSLMAALRPGRSAGRGFGALSSARSVGLFVGNLALGLLYGLGPSWSYTYAAVVAAAAALVVLRAVPSARLARDRLAEASPAPAGEGA
jgi:MFS family permease